MASRSPQVSATHRRPAAAFDIGDLEIIDSSQVLTRLRAVFESPSYQPPRLPDAAIKLLALTKRANVDFRQIQSVLAEDQLLTAETLRLAQSAAHGGGSMNPITSLEEALLRLGLQRTTDLFLHAALNARIFRVKGYQLHMDRLRQHSTLVAHLARFLSRRTALYDEHAFLCGLLHDVGIAAGLVAIAESYGARGAPAFELVWPALKSVHGQAGAALSRIWQLPPEVAIVLRHHHEFELHGRVHPTCAVIALADAIASELGVGESEAGREWVPKALAALGLTQKDYEGALREGESYLDP